MLILEWQLFAKQILMLNRVAGSRFAFGLKVLSFDGRMGMQIRRFHAGKLCEY